MANVKKGQLASAPQWWKHLREWKRVFWKRERKAAKRIVVHEMAQSCRTASAGRNGPAT